jgi:hypothetical protein
MGGLMISATDTLDGILPSPDRLLGDGAAAGLVPLRRGPRRGTCEGITGPRGARAPVAIRSAGSVLPQRGDSVADWDRFVALARLSRSAAELLAALLHRPVRAEPVGNRVFEIQAGGHPDAGRHVVRVVQHRLFDSRAPHGALALCATALVGARLPDCIRPAARRGSDPLSELLDRASAFWTPETVEVEELSADAAQDAGWTGNTPVVRLTRRLFLLGTPVADVVEDIPFPGSAAERGPPTP